MKYNCFLLLCILATQTIHSQQTGADGVKTDNVATHQRRIDSLQKLIKEKPSNDSIKIAHLFSLSEIYFSDMRYAEGLAVAEEAKSLSDKSNYAKGAALYLQVMAKFHKNSMLGFYYANEADWLSGQKRTLEQLSNSVSTDEQLEIVKLKEARLVVDKRHDSLSLANIDFALMTSYLNSNQDSMAMHLAERPLRIFKQRNDVLPVFEILRRKMNYHDRRGNKAAAKELEIQMIKTIAGSIDKKMIALISYGMGRNYYSTNRFGLALEFFIKADNALENLEIETFRINVLYQIGETYDLAGLYQKAVEYYERCFALRKKANDTSGIGYEYISVTFPLVKLGRFEEVHDYVLKARTSIDSSQQPAIFCRTYDAEGQALMAQGKHREAIQKFMVVLPVWEKQALYTSSSYIYYYLSQCYQMLGDLSLSLRNAHLGYRRAVQGEWRVAQINSSLQISNLYDATGQVAKAYEYLKIHKQIKDDIQEQDNLNRVADIEIQSILEKSQRELDVLEKDRKIAEETNRNQQLWIFSSTGALLSAILVLFILYRNNRQKQNAKAKIEQAYVDLKATQAQLIQSEKMASLGELTAGIAHEIQNPLNFVNNFSEANKELLSDMQQAIGQHDYAEVAALATDLIKNEERIAHHGRRADAIVKNMLQHSRSSTGEKQPTDINALADEYLRLSFHGMRAKDKTFNAVFETHFDKTIGDVNVMPQEIGRVLLNLFNNAFYAVFEKKSQLNGNYEPVVSVSTKRQGKVVEITVKDNGTGIPQKAVDKIFQPFFTTKPTGQGTGLGLSLSYDIIKAHGGEISVESKDGGTNFIIQLPANNLRILS